MTNCYRSIMKSDAANAIFAGLDNQARFVGGCVRDALLGIDADDIDIITPFLPDEVTVQLQKKNIKVIPTGIKHGTVTAVTHGRSFEITTLRRDVDCFGRHAKVEFTDSWEEDAARRDFTINAMSCTQDGEMFDYFGGVSDLENNRLRFVGDAVTRCREDYLRILRFFRFYARYGKAPADNPALNACTELASGIETLSGERIKTEMFKLLSSPSPLDSLRLMLETGVMEYAIPGTPPHHVESLALLIRNIHEVTASSPILRLAVLVDRRTDLAHNIIKRWKLSNAEKDRLLFLANPDHTLPPDADEKLAKQHLRKWGTETYAEICLLEYAKGMETALFQNLYALTTWEIPQFPVAGRDLIHLGFKPGRHMGQILQAAEHWWEELDYRPQKAKILDFVRQLDIKP